MMCDGFVTERERESERERERERQGDLEEVPLYLLP